MLRISLALLAVSAGMILSVQAKAGEKNPEKYAEEAPTTDDWFLDHVKKPEVMDMLKALGKVAVMKSIDQAKKVAILGAREHHGANGDHCLVRMKLGDYVFHAIMFKYNDNLFVDKMRTDPKGNTPLNEW